MKTTTSSPSAKRSVAVFRSISEANRWLSRRSSIVILNLRTKAHRSKLQRIIIDYITYPQPVNIRYGIDKTTYLSRHRATTPETHADRWSAKRNSKEFVLCELTKSHESQKSLIRSTFITLYKTEKSDLQQVF